MFFNFGGGDPFMGGMGSDFHSAFGGGSSSSRQQTRQQVNNTKFYELLEITQTADENEIKKAYRKLALKHHPDRGMSYIQ